MKNYNAIGKMHAETGCLNAPLFQKSGLNLIKLLGAYLEAPSPVKLMELGA